MPDQSSADRAFLFDPQIFKSHRYKDTTKEGIYGRYKNDQEVGP